MYFQNKNKLIVKTKFLEMSDIILTLNFLLLVIIRFQEDTVFYSAYFRDLIVKINIIF